MGSVPPKTSSSSDQEARTEHALPIPFASFLFFNENRLQIFIILHASYAWDTGFPSFRLLITQYKLYGIILFICHNA